METRIAEQDERALRQRRITIFGQQLMVFGDSSAYHDGLRWNIAGRRATLPEDGRAWENEQMRAQREAFSRDSVLRERVQANRARREAEGEKR